MAFGLVDLVDRRDIGVGQRCRRSGLTDKPGLGLGITGHLRRQELQRHRAVELAVLSLVDDSHAASAKLGYDLVVGYGFTDHGEGILASFKHYSQNNTNLLSMCCLLNYWILTLEGWAVNLLGLYK